MESLDFRSLAKAVGQLAAGIAQAEADPKNELLRDGVIQRFEYTYELSWKMLKRYLAAVSANPQDVDAMSFQALIRTGSEYGLLLSGWDIWLRYRTAARHHQPRLRRREGARGIRHCTAVPARGAVPARQAKPGDPTPMSTVETTIDALPQQLETIATILKRTIPDREVWAFGSRTSGAARRYSDLDLVVLGQTPLSLDQIGRLAYDFDESDLPFKVDVVDWATSSESFRRIIAGNAVVVQTLPAP